MLNLAMVDRDGLAERGVASIRSRNGGGRTVVSPSAVRGLVGMVAAAVAAMSLGRCRLGLR